MERPIEASATIQAAFGRVRQVLLDEPGVLFGETQAPDERRARRFRIDLGVDLGQGASLHQTAMVQVGAARSSPAGVVLPLAWQPTGRGRMLPTFEGELEASEVRTGTGLQLTGTYTVPLGLVGRFGDGVVGRRLARRSLGALMEQVAWRLESEVDRRLDSPARRQVSRPVELHEDAHSEIYVG
jgi:hypothetical protein